MIASLGMYLRPETQAATDSFWHLTRDNLWARGTDAPTELARSNPFWEVWQSPDLVFSQTCGRPFRLRLHDRVSLVGTPDYGLPGCPAGHYRSVFVVRNNDARSSLPDYRDAVFAFNEKLSQSGWSAPQCHVARLGFQFENIAETGGHRNSALCVCNEQADIAALDAMTWQLIQRFDAFSENLRVLDQTEPSPGLPYITSKTLCTTRVFEAVQDAISNLRPADRRILQLKGLIRIPASDYMAVPDPVR